MTVRFALSFKWRKLQWQRSWPLGDPLWDVKLAQVSASAGAVVASVADQSRTAGHPENMGNHCVRMLCDR
jgi:hypothetical protein